MKYILFFLINALFLFCQPTLTFAMDTKSIALGNTTAFSAKPDAVIRLSPAGIFNLSETAEGIELKAIKVGEAMLEIDQEKFQLKVFNARVNQLHSDLKKLLDTKLGMVAETGPNGIEIKGTCYLWQDWEDVRSFFKRNNQSFSFKVQWEIDNFETHKYRFSEIIKKWGLPEPQYDIEDNNEIVFPNSIVISPVIEKRIHELGFRIRNDSKLIASELSIRVQVTVAEVSRRLQKDLGIDWPQSFEAQMAPRFQSPAALMASLKLIEDRGLGQILASPNLLTKSGTEAEFLAGGEFPIKVSSHGVREVYWKKHGILLKILPRADRTGRMSLDISTEVSLIDGATIVEGIPGLKTNRMNTHIDLDYSQTIVLSGLLRQDQVEGSKSVPGFKSIPILGRLFQSEQYIRMKSELVIFLTPEVITPDMKSVRPTIPKTWKPFNEIQ